MKAEVIKSYTDKETKVLHKVGEVITVTKERFEEINSTALGPFVKEVKKKGGN
ncbi:MAG TPA: hypothetical protein VN549_05650 [Negativicutes bacterium]|nr:hypothetical protein [Negativicutes bacterium]